MVSFSCEGCGDVLTKKKLDPHTRQCHGASFTCLDCMVHFWGTEYRTHTSCISEAQKYQGNLYRPEKEKKGKGKTNTNTNTNNNQKAVVPKNAYVEDVPEEYSQRSAVTIDTPPEAPSPPSAAPDFVPQELEESQDSHNVFDFLVEGSTSAAPLLKIKPSAETPSRIYEDDQAKGMIIQYGSTSNELETPANKKDRRGRSIKEDGKKSDKKRKRLHVDTSPPPTDEHMADAPSSLHTGLTGGLNKLLARPSDFPPSPDYSGADAVDSPASPLKRSKRERANTANASASASRSKNKETGGGSSRSIGESLLGMFTNGTIQKKSSSKEKERDSKKSKRETTSNQNQRPSSAPGMSDSQQVVMYEQSGPLTAYDPIAARERGQLFLEGITKGSESEKGYSVNKALKRYHRERNAGEQKGWEEKELWRSLRLKRNDRGEVVVFVADDAQ